MKLSCPHAVMDRVLYLLHGAEQDYLLLQRTGPGWIVEIPRPLTAAVQAKAEALGAKALT